jgi:hypothetical protein
MFLSPRAQKAQQESQGRHNAQQAFHDRGPHLNDDSTYVIVPSVEYNAAMASKLKANGFVFEPGEYPRWTRCATYAARDGKVYSARAWFKWTRDLYAEVWDWEPIKEEA